MFLLLEGHLLERKLRVFLPINCLNIWSGVSMPQKLQVHFTSCPTIVDVKYRNIGYSLISIFSSTHVSRVKMSNIHDNSWICNFVLLISRLCGLLCGWWNCCLLWGKLNSTYTIDLCMLLWFSITLLKKYSTYCSLLRDSGKRNLGGTVYHIFFVVHYQRREQPLKLVSHYQTLLCQMFLWGPNGLLKLAKM